MPRCSGFDKEDSKDNVDRSGWLPGSLPCSHVDTSFSFWGLGESYWMLPFCSFLVLGPIFIKCNATQCFWFFSIPSLNQIMPRSEGCSWASYWS